MIELKTTCSKCGGPLEENRIGKQRYCLACHAAHMRETRPKHSELSEEARRKANVRAATKEYVSRGKITKKPCAVCGNVKSEAHHPDYSKPLEVIWLCRIHHLKLHRNEQVSHETLEEVEI